MNNLIGRNEPNQLDHTYGSDVVNENTEDVASEKQNTESKNYSDPTRNILENNIDKNYSELQEVSSLPKKENDLKKEAKSCLWSTIRYIDELNDSTENIEEICTKIIKATKNLLPKSKQMTCTISRIVDSKALIEKCKSPEMLCSNMTDKKHSNLEIKSTVRKINISNNTGLQENNKWALATDSKHEFSSDLVRHSPDKRTNPRKTNEKQTLGSQTPRFKVLKSALNENVWDFSWWLLACTKPEESLLILSEEFNSDERDKLLEKFLLAKTVWACGKCQNLSVDSMLSGYIECSVCCEWFHRTCCSSDTLNETFEDQFSCDKCIKFSNDQMSHNNVFTDVVSYIVTDVQY